MNGTKGRHDAHQIPAFRLPESVLDEEVNYILDMGHPHPFQYLCREHEGDPGRITTPSSWAPAPPVPRPQPARYRQEADANIHLGIEWLVQRCLWAHLKDRKESHRPGGGNTAMDCCRTSRRLGGDEVKVIVRSPFKEEGLALGRSKTLSGKTFLS